MSNLVRKTYFQEIDGLRAIAVLAVIFYHFNIDYFSGGYIGVDVFFVISGYLITYQILNHLDNGNFSFKEFYIRRIRRLAPAFIVMLIFSFALGYVYMDAGNFKKFSESFIYSIFSISNIYFYNEVGYFDQSASLKPLLHTWSLSVEEQFYVVWPALLLIIYNFQKRHIGITLLIIGCASLLFAELLIREKPEMVFYLPFLRVYEFVIGALCIWLKKYVTGREVTQEILFMTGLLFIVWTVFTYNDATVFPGVNSLLPCIGTMFVIISGNPKYSGRLLTNKPIVYIGLISYSLYLFHWPILVFANYIVVGDLNIELRVLMMSLTFILGYLSYKFVETPVRTNNFYASNKKLVIAYVASLILLTPVAIASYSQNGWEWRASEFEQWVEKSRFNHRAERFVNIRTKKCHLAKKKGVTFDSFEWGDCLSTNDNKKNYLVLGDSHAADLWFALSESIPGTHFLQMTGAGCRPYHKVHLESSDCHKMLVHILKGSFSLSEIDGVILSWRATKNYASFIETVFLLQEKNPQLNIVVFGPTPEFEHAVPMLLSKYNSEILINYYIDETIAPLDVKMAEFFEKNNIEYVSRYQLFCPDNTCPILSNSGIPLFIDAAHWSSAGAKYFGDRLNEQHLDTLFNR